MTAPTPTLMMQKTRSRKSTARLLIPTMAKGSACASCLLRICVLCTAGGQLIAEFSGSTGSLLKEYIYGADGLLATIEPTAVNSNGTRYTTSDHLGSPRVVTNSGASVISRHDYMPFGEELGAGIGGRSTSMGFPGTSDGLRQKFTSKERDGETGLDYFGERYYASTMGRFTTVDTLGGSMRAANPQDRKSV